MTCASYISQHIHPYFLFFFTDTATTEIYTLSLHDALPICSLALQANGSFVYVPTAGYSGADSFSYKANDGTSDRSEEHTSELQSHVNLVCRLLLEKKKKTSNISLQSS